VLPPGISEDPASRHHVDQMDLWVRGATRPAPLSRPAIEPLVVSRIRLKTQYLPW
jgi:acyl-homoserine lactone acylase PvdQ